MVDEYASDVAVQHADGSSACPTAKNGARWSMPRSRRERSASDAVIVCDGLSDRLSGPSAASPPRVEPIVRSLRVRLGEGLGFAVIAAEVEAELSRYANARVTQFIPILVESRVWERLRRHVSA